MAATSQGQSIQERSLEEARQEAYEDSQQQVDERHVTKALDKLKSGLEPVAKEIRSSRKPRLRIIEHYLCDECDRLISEPGEGFIIHGNVYVADPTHLGGLIGNNFPDSDEPIDPSMVKKTVMCRMCFMKALGLFNPHQEKKTKHIRSVDQLYEQFGHSDMMLSANTTPRSRRT